MGLAALIVGGRDTDLTERGQGTRKREDPRRTNAVIVGNEDAIGLRGRREDNGRAATTESSTAHSAAS